MDGRTLGQSIRQLRNKAGVGLRELSRLADISPASLTGIEKGRSSPTLATLHKILKAIGTDFAEFFANSAGDSEEPVFRRERMRGASDKNREYVFLLPKRGDMSFEMVDETIEPREKRAEWESHDCDVGGVILSGEPARLEIEGQGQWTIHKGDSFYIKAGLKHRMVNLGKRTIRQITVMTPPQY